MYLEELLIERFTAHGDRRLLFRKPITIVVGPNASGKTSIKDALEWNLTGACRSTDAGGRGYENLITVGEEVMEVKARIANQIAIRTANGKGVEFSVEGWQGGRKTLEAEFYKKITGGKPLTKGQIHVLMNSTYFLSLPLAEQREMLFAALGFDFGKDELPEMVNGQVDRARLADILEPIAETKRGAKLLDAVHAAGFAERREAKRTLKVLEDQADDRPDTELPTGIETADLKDSQALLTRLRRDRDGLVAKRDGFESGAQDRARIEAEMKRLETRHGDLEAQVADGEKMLKALNLPDLSEFKARIETQREQGAKVAGQLAAVYSEIARLTRVVEQFEANPGHCVADPTIACTLTGKGTKVYAALHEALASAREAKGSLEAAKAMAVKGLAAMAEELEAKEKGYRQKAGLEAKLSATKASLEDIAEQIEAKGHELMAIVKSLKPVPDSLVAEIAALEGRIAKGESLVEAIIRREEVEKHIKARKEQIGAAQARVATLEQMVEVFGPEGIVVSMLSERKEALLGPMVAAVVSLTAGEYELSFADDLSVRVKHGGRDLPVESLSSSERLRIGIGVQVGLARALSFPLIVIDRADMLDPENRGLFAEGLAALANEGLQVIVLATASEDVVGGDETTDYVVLRRQTAEVTQ